MPRPSSPKRGPNTHQARAHLTPAPTLTPTLTLTLTLTLTRPELTEDGTGGVYLIRSCSPVAEGEGLPSPVAVFKPSDEEAGSHNNPRGLDGEEHI